MSIESGKYAIDGPALYGPMKLAIFWLAGTFLLFIVVGNVVDVPDLSVLSAFVAATIGCFAAGYWMSNVRARSGGLAEPRSLEDNTGRVGLLVTLSAFYYLAYGLTYMDEYGVLSLSSISSALMDPGAAYLAKFSVYEQQSVGNATNASAQVITLLAALSAPLVPFLVVYWRRLALSVKLLAASAVTVYASFFLAIGTLVGLGNLVIFGLVGVMVTRARGRRLRNRRRVGAALAVTLTALAFAGYMSYNQADRLITVGGRADFEPNPIAASVVGDQLSRGVSVTLFYPTHGYEGLAYNLDTPFRWTKGRGASKAIDSYLDQYGFGESVESRTYPARTEMRTGWPAGRSWATIYPWLASDLTFPGAAAFMFAVGWWMARWWYETIVLGSRLAMLLFGQAAVLIAYVPANNQLGLGRPNVICILSLLVLYLLRRRSRTTERRVDRKRSLAPAPNTGGCRQ